MNSCALKAWIGNYRGLRVFDVRVPIALARIIATRHTSLELTFAAALIKPEGKHWLSLVTLALHFDAPVALMGDFGDRWIPIGANRLPWKRVDDPMALGLHVECDICGKPGTRQVGQGRYCSDHEAEARLHRAAAHTKYLANKNQDAPGEIKQADRRLRSRESLRNCKRGHR